MGSGKIIGIISLKGGSENQWHASELCCELAHNSLFSGHPFKLGGVLK